MAEKQYGQSRFHDSVARGALGDTLIAVFVQDRNSPTGESPTAEPSQSQRDGGSIEAPVEQPGLAKA